MIFGEFLPKQAKQASQNGMTLSAAHSPHRMQGVIPRSLASTSFLFQTSLLTSRLLLGSVNNSSRRSKAILPLIFRQRPTICLTTLASNFVATRLALKVALSGTTSPPLWIWYLDDAEPTTLVEPRKIQQEAMSGSKNRAQLVGANHVVPADDAARAHLGP